MGAGAGFMTPVRNVAALVGERRSGLAADLPCLVAKILRAADGCKTE